MNPAFFLAASMLAAAPLELVDQIFSRYNTPASPGCAVGILHNGKTVHAKGYGMANLELGVPITPESAFYLGSTSKEFTAAAILLAAESGPLKLDDPIRKYLPDLPPYMQPIMVRHLLEHSSGIRDYIGLWTLSGPADDAPLSDEQVYNIITSQKALNFTPGEEFLYSNSNYFLLGRILGPAAFRQLKDYATDQIFRPLGMAHTFYYKDRFQLIPKRATGYARSGGDYRISTATLDVLGDGGVFTTLEDGLKWLQTIDSPQGAFARILLKMRVPAKLNSGETAEYGRGLMLKRHRRLDILSHVGGLRGYRSEILYIPERRFGVVCLCNTNEADPGRLSRLVADVFLGLKAAPIPQLSKAELERKTGDFRDKATGDVLQLQFAAGQFFALYQGFQIPLLPETPMRFRAESPLSFEIEFQQAGDRDEPRFLRVESESHRPARLERITLERARPANLEQYEGIYACGEAQSRLNIRISDGALWLEQNDQSIGVLEVMQRDRFRSATLNLEFLRDAGGKVTGFRLNTGRVRGLVFQRAATPTP